MLKVQGQMAMFTSSYLVSVATQPRFSSGRQVTPEISLRKEGHTSLLWTLLTLARYVLICFLFYHLNANIMNLMFIILYFAAKIQGDDKNSM